MKAGKARKPRRIQEALDKHGLTLADIARELGNSRSLVCQTAHGYSNNRRVLRRFLDLGVDPVDLDLPTDLQEKILVKSM